MEEFLSQRLWAFLQSKFESLVSFQSHPSQELLICSQSPLASVDCDNGGQFHFMMSIVVPIGRYKLLWVWQQWVTSEAYFTSTCPEFIMDLGWRPIHPQWPPSGQWKHWWLDMSASWRQLCLSLSSPAAPGEPSELLTPQMSLLSAWGRKIINVY